MTTLRLSVPKARDAYNRTPVPLRLDPADKITTSITHAGGTGLIYYKSTDTVTETSNDGTLTAGQTLYLTATVYLLASVLTDITVEQSAGSLTKAEFSRLRAFGHSYLQDSTGASIVDKAFVNIVTGMLGAQSENMAIGGSSSYLAAPGAITRMLQSTTPGFNAPWQPYGQLYVICTGLNDVGDTKQITEPTIVTDSLRDTILRARAGGVHEVEGSYNGNAGWTRGGAGWTTNSSTSINSGTANWQASTNGCTWTYKTPTNFPGGTVELHGLRTVNSGATHAVTLNGVAFGTWDTRGATQSQFRPTLYRVTNVPAGQQTIAGTVTNIGASNEFLDYAQFPSPNPPIVAVLTQNRVFAYPSGTHTIVDADITTLNALIRTMISTEFLGDPRVVIVDADAIINKNALYFGDGVGGGDQLHPNDEGHGLIAQALYTAVINAASTVPTIAGRLLPYNVIYAPRVPEAGTDPRMGLATLVAGTVSVTSYQINANTRIRLNRQTPLGTALGHLSVSAKTATVGTTAGSFTITAKSATNVTETNDISTVVWEIVEPA